MSENQTRISEDIIQRINEELERRFAPHAGDPLYDEIRRVRRDELLTIEQRKQEGAA